MVFSGKFLMRNHAVFGNADNGHISFSKFTYMVAKTAGFFDTVGGLVFGIKIDNQPFALVVGKGMRNFVLPYLI